MKDSKEYAKDVFGIQRCNNDFGAGGSAQIVASLQQQKDENDAFAEALIRALASAQGFPKPAPPLVRL